MSVVNRHRHIWYATSSSFDDEIVYRCPGCGWTDCGGKASDDL